MRHRHCYPPGNHVHHVVCKHQVEIEVWPADAEVYFSDERYVDEVNTQVRFDAVVMNAPSCGVVWSVLDEHGNSVSGRIDNTGLYTAPPWNTYKKTVTETVVAASADDPSRKAYAYVAIAGRGPEPPRPQSVTIMPRRACLYLSSAGFNQYVDQSNMRQIFRAQVVGSDDGVDWFIDGVAAPGGSGLPVDGCLLTYVAPSSGSPRVVTVEAKLAGNHNVKGTAKVFLINYTWPGIV